MPAGLGSRRLFLFGHWGLKVDLGVGVDGPVLASSAHLRTVDQLLAVNIICKSPRFSLFAPARLAPIVLHESNCNFLGFTQSFPSRLGLLRHSLWQCGHKHPLALEATAYFFRRLLDTETGLRGLSDLGQGFTGRLKFLGRVQSSGRPNSGRVLSHRGVKVPIRRG